MKKNEKLGRKIVSRQVKQEEAALLSAYKKSLGSINDELRKSKVFGIKPVGKITKASRMKTLARNIEGEIAKLQHVEQKIIGDVVGESYKHSYYRGAHALETEIGGNIGFGMLNPKTVDAVVVNKMSLIKWPDSSKTNAALMTKRIKGYIEQGVIQGQSLQKVSEVVQKQMNIGAGKAMRVIRTETGRAQNEGALKVYDEAQAEDLPVIRIWIVGLDEKTRFSHREMDGKKADENNYFHLPSGALTRGPHLSGIPEEDINCRCALSAEIPDMPAEVRAVRDPVSGKSIDIKAVPYDVWAKAKKVKHHEKVRVICTSECRPLGFGKKMPTFKEFHAARAGEKSLSAIKYDYIKLRKSLGIKVTPRQEKLYQKWFSKFEATSIKVVGKIKTKPLTILKVKPAKIPVASTKGWKPYMSNKEAVNWAKNSIYKEPTFHVTSKQSAKAIKKSGFKLMETKLGKAWGDGIYVGEMHDTKALKMYKGFVRKGETLKCKLNLRKVFEYDVTEVHGIEATVHKKLAKKVGVPTQEYKQAVKAQRKLNDKLEDQFFDLAIDPKIEDQWLFEHGYSQVPGMGVIQKYLQKRGYDAMNIIESSVGRYKLVDYGGNQLIVFNTKAITVIR